MSLYAGQDRESLRAAWRTAWQRHLEGLPLEPLQAQMAGLIAQHPEYHGELGVAADRDAVAAGASSAQPEGNAFLHLSLHLALREQLATDRPRGIVAVHRRLVAQAPAAHEAEHRMMDVLARTLWDAQRQARMPDEQQYLEDLRRL